MIKINPNRMLTAAAVYFKDDKEPIKDCVLFILDKFAIIARDPDDGIPTWYNIDLIDRIECVGYWTAPTQKTQTQTTYQGTWQSLW